MNPIRCTICLSSKYLGTLILKLKFKKSVNKNLKNFDFDSEGRWEMFGKMSQLCIQRPQRTYTKPIFRITIYFARAILAVVIGYHITREYLLPFTKLANVVLFLLQILSTFRISRVFL